MATNTETKIVMNLMGQPFFADISEEGIREACIARGLPVMKHGDKAIDDITGKEVKIQGAAPTEHYPKTVLFSLESDGDKVRYHRPWEDGNLTPLKENAGS